MLLRRRLLLRVTLRRIASLLRRVATLLRRVALLLRRCIPVRKCSILVSKKMRW